MVQRDVTRRRGKSPAPRSARAARSKSPAPSRSKSPKSSPKRSVTASPERKASKAKADLIEEIEEEAAEWAAENIKLRVAPLLTIKHFLLAVQEGILYWLHAALRKWGTCLVGVVAFVAWEILLRSGYFLPPESELAKNLKYYIDATAVWIAWWFALGVASSIGVGTGLHSGILYLFPWILTVVRRSAKEEHVGFYTFGCDSNPFIFDTSPFGTCDGAMFEDPKEKNPETFVALLLKVLLPCFAWGAGTAMGEVPPYALALAASRAGKMHKEFEQMKNDKSGYNYVNEMKEWMLDVIGRWGFWGVFLFSAWPNAMFDLCGMCCGHIQMPFWSFFGGTFLGKACVKAPGQAIFFLTLFNKKTMEYAIQQLAKLVDFVRLDEFLCENACEEYFKKRALLIIENFDHKTEEVAETDWKSWLKPGAILNYIVTLIIILFLLSVVDTFAQENAKNQRAEAKRRAKRLN